MPAELDLNKVRQLKYTGLKYHSMDFQVPRICPSINFSRGQEVAPDSELEVVISAEWYLFVDKRLTDESLQARYGTTMFTDLIISKSLFTGLQPGGDWPEDGVRLSDGAQRLVSSLISSQITKSFSQIGGVLALDWCAQHPTDGAYNDAFKTTLKIVLPLGKDLWETQLAVRRSEMAIADAIVAEYSTIEPASDIRH